MTIRPQLLYDAQTTETEQIMPGLSAVAQGNTERKHQKSAGAPAHLAGAGTEPVCQALAGVRATGRALAHLAPLLAPPLGTRRGGGRTTPRRTHLQCFLLAI